MLNHILLYVMVITISYFTTKISIPYVQLLGEKYKLLDKPNSRKQHSIPITRIGGISLLIGFILSNLSIIVFDLFDNRLLDNNDRYIVILVGALFFFSIGILDDIYNIKPLPRLIYQFLAAFMIWSFGIRIDIMHLINNESTTNLSIILSMLTTTIWIVGITNSINWIDGLDGLAIGITGISSIGILLISLSSEEIIIKILSISLIGANLGFLKYNTYPSKILMGDGGSYLLGYLIAMLSILIANNNLMQEITLETIYLPFLILFIPITDMTYVIIKRINSGKSPFYPDRIHIHHRLVDNSYTHKKSVQIIYAWHSLFVSLAVVSKIPKIGLILLTTSILLILVLDKNIKLINN